MNRSRRKKKIAFCGIVCTSCPAYIAARKIRPKVQVRIAQLWSDQENSYDACDITCKGCTEAWGKKFKHCTDCQVRDCARKRGIETCAECEEYPCQKLEQLYESLDEKIERVNLNVLRKKQLSK